MLGIGERACGSFDVLPTTLIVERASNRCRDERAPLTLTDPAVESTDNLVIQAYVHTHGHTLAHTVIRATFSLDRDFARFSSVDHHAPGAPTAASA